MATEVRVPTLGESVTEATVSSWYKKIGDRVEVDEMLCELETDKVTVEAPSPVAGVLRQINFKEGDTVEPGRILAMIEEAGDDAAAQPATHAEMKVEPAPDPAAGPSLAFVAEQAAAKASGEAVDIVVPALGESVTEATVGSWFKAPGEAVKADEVLCELETDKVSVEVAAPTAGALTEIVAKEGETVGLGAVLAQFTSGEGAVASGAGATAVASSPDGKDVEHAPSAKKIMAEKGLSPDQVTGTGRDGRIMKEDVVGAASPAAPGVVAGMSTATAVANAASAAGSTSPATNTASGPREERVRMTRLRQTIARRLKDAQNTAAMLTTYNEVDMSQVMALRSEYKEAFEKKHGVRLGFMSFFVKAVVHALSEIPAVNAQIDGTDLIYKNYANIGVAVGTPQGLVVPVVRDAQTLGFADIEKAINTFGRKARDGELSLDDMQGGTFTISNGGVYGSLMSSPILNPPQSGILGMHAIQKRPVVVGDEIVIRPMMYLALSYDHRIVDGKEAVTFLVRVKEAIEDPRRLLMDL